MAKIVSQKTPCLFGKIDQVPELLLAHASEPLPQKSLELPVEGCQELRPGRGDPHLDHSAIFFSPGSRQESSSLQAVKEPRQVRLKPDHPGPDLLAGEALGSRSPENPEGVVLGRRDTVGFERRLERLLEDRRGPLDVEGRLL